MSTNERSDHDYVNSRTARSLQDDRARDARAGSDQSAPPNGPEAAGRRGRLRRLIRWVRGLAGPKMVGSLLAVLALTLGACDSGDPGGQDRATPTPDDVEGTATAGVAGETECRDPQGDVYAVDPERLPTERTSNVAAVDIPQAALDATEEGIALLFERRDPPPPPAVGTHVRHDLMLRDADGQTGLLRATWEAGPEGEWQVSAGADEDDLESIEPVGVSATPQQTVIRVDWTSMPVQAPFSWAAEVTMVESGVADICPNVDPQDPFADAAAVPTFPDDDTVEVDPDGSETVDVTGVNYAFEGVPEEASVGTRLAFTNDAEESHELVLLRLQDDHPSVEEFVRMPRPEGEQHVDELVGVSIAMPELPGVMREGTLRLDEPGTYVLLCSFPTGVTAEHVKDNFAGPPMDAPEEFGPPHVVQGMWAAIDVTE